MKEYKICPILSTSKHLSEIMGTNSGLVLCEGEECGLWDESNKCCSMNAKSSKNVDARVQVFNS